MTFDLDKLEALAKAATPGPWEWWTSNSFRRLTGPDGRDGGVLSAVVHRDGQPDVLCSDANRAHIAAASPDVVLELIRQIRAGRGLFGPANDAPPEVQVEIRAAELAANGSPNTCGVTEDGGDCPECGWYDRSIDCDCGMDDKPGWHAGWLAHAIVNHDEEQREMTEVGDDCKRDAPDD